MLNTYNKWYTFLTWIGFVCVYIVLGECVDEIWCQNNNSTSGILYEFRNLLN